MDVKEADLQVKEAFSKLVGHEVASLTKSRIFNRLITQSGESILAVVGPAGVGKSAVCDSVKAKLLEYFAVEMEADQGFVPFLSVSVPAPLTRDFSWRDEYARLLTVSGEPLMNKKRKPLQLELDGAPIASTRGLYGNDYRRCFEKMIKNRGTRIIFFEEASGILAGNEDMVRQFNILKTLAIENGLIVVVIGAYDILGLQDANGQILRRSDIFHMPMYNLTGSAATEPFPGDQATHEDGSIISDFDHFGRALVGLAKNAPVKCEPGIFDDVGYYMMKSIGCVGNMRNWLYRSCVDALLSKEQVLTKRILQFNGYRIDSLRKLLLEAQLGEERLADIEEKELADEYGVSSLRDYSPGVTEIIPKVRKKLAIAQNPGKRAPSRDLIGRTE